MDKGIIGFLEGLPDGRRKAGRRHGQAFVLLLVLMGTMCGHHGYRSIGDFIARDGPAYCFISSPLKAVCQAFVQLGVPYRV